ncbi:DUF3759 domain-containing protein [Aspergillus brunneoviolaceus CBS 621.78]|uniref:Phosphoglycerate mutase family protein n=2 Tax=Aspergillus TaxID=5052 RepID=A0A8G1RVU8_9EURO|nr:hypothetical protein BO95DRAFT_442352 [Aspergillus brunneoviolaceus CBS 621.78]XP_040804164.1 uncharacterized protein BO72DRAFT_398549 [Aspergillus fijiensis CBS 313.89]RAH46258.1 hypothetical protein BO95DRAFT_442352 [Aspergillus brunneoviolaceus CBS 621.78]RAK80154.1 hypothetical protein BO72DRAFT_398549 [Aspergillus fijiensis CBS 313.89]
MGWFDFGSDQQQAHEELTSYEGFDGSEEHKAKFSHELIAGAASFEAMKAYEEHQERNGKPESHEMAKELLAGFAGAFIDREVETKGLDFVDREKAKRQAERQLEEASRQDYY